MTRPAARVRRGCQALGRLLVVFVSCSVPAAVHGQDAWTSLGPPGGLVQAMAIATTTPETIYAATRSGVYVRSSPHADWQPASAGLTDPDVRVLAAALSSPATLFAGTPTGLFKTSDGGATWLRSANGLPAGEVSAVAIDPAAATTVYAGTAAGVFVTVNGGSSWEPATSGLPAGQVRSIAIDPLTPSTVYAAVGSRVFKTFNGGTTWSAVGNVSTLTTTSLAIDPQTPSTLYVIGLGSFSLPPIGNVFFGVLFKSTDAGASWSEIHRGGGTNVMVAVDPIRPSFLYLTDGTAVKMSATAGATWSTAFLPNSGEVRALAVSREAPTTIWAGTRDGGAFVSIDAGASWSADTDGIRATAIPALAVDASRPRLIYAAIPSQGVLKTIDGGTTWAPAGPINESTILSLAVDPSAPATVYAGTRLRPRRQVISTEVRMVVQRGGLSPIPSPAASTPSSSIRPTRTSPTRRLPAC